MTDQPDVRDLPLPAVEWLTLAVIATYAVWDLGTTCWPGCGCRWGLWTGLAIAQFSSLQHEACTAIRSAAGC
jgi:hypothetical protein